MWPTALRLTRKRRRNPERRWHVLDRLFSSRAGIPDANRRINTTGHILEWLSLAMTDEELKEPWMQSAANALAMLILDNERTALEGGGMYHAVHGLLLYTNRVYGSDKLGDLKPHFPPPPPSKK